MSNPNPDYHYPQYYQQEPSQQPYIDPSAESYPISAPGGIAPYPYPDLGYQGYPPPGQNFPLVYPQDPAEYGNFVPPADPAYYTNSPVAPTHLQPGSLRDTAYTPSPTHSYTYSHPAVPRAQPDFPPQPFDNLIPPGSNSAPAPIKLRIKRPLSHPPPVKPVQPDQAEAMNRRSSNTSRHPPDPYSSSGRMRRPAAGVTSYKEEPESEDEKIDLRPTRSGRSIKAPARYAQDDGADYGGGGGSGRRNTRVVDEDDFENTMMTSPVMDTPVKMRTAKSVGKAKKRIIDPDDEDEDDAEGEIELDDASPPPRAQPTRSTRSKHNEDDDDADFDDSQQPRHGRNTGNRSTRVSNRAKSRHSSADAESYREASASATDEEEVVISPERDFDEFDDDADSHSDSPRPRRTTRAAPRRQPPPRQSNARRSTRASARNTRDDLDEPKRTLRERPKVNYQLPPLDVSAEINEATIAAAANAAGASKKRGVGFAGGTRFGSRGGGLRGMPWAMGGGQPGKMTQSMGDPDTSDSDLDMMTPKKPMTPSGTGGGQAAIGGAPAAGMRVQGPSDVPNFGRVNPKSNMADADPLGVDVNVTFDNVGGLDGHINQLKEMVALPLLYPELFQQFGVTPPRGVLFHGPPGTGKTLLARALAASCSNGNTKISFFMRKGADVLSKWVGEAERQLRMLFEEARAAQPSIIFFDEIDGLAPVRSSKQDQIHASLVSTLLALMDGMDGRGQVIVIGATNRPDAVDSALRRPGRFDREFYFPLPNREARKKIIGINTRKWSPQLNDDRLDQLAGLTKGYGGADLRALCTEAALNAIQRRYPQIYTSTDRLLLDPASITVGAKDFMISVKKIIPSSARSTSSSASQLPPHLAPLLTAPLERVKTAVDKVLPRHQTKTALEEAQYEDDIGDDLDKYMMIQSLDKMRTFCPRVLVHGPSGMGQKHLGSAVLHHLEGFHVQTLDLGTLMGDSAKSPEAALVQLFVEAKRHQPSVLYIPSLTAFVSGLSDTARSTFTSLLDSIPSADPVLLLGICNEPIVELPRDVRKWFGVGKEGKVVLERPSPDDRESYFSELISTFSKPPTAFPDALPKRKRVLEILPLAPPLPPRALSQVEIQRELDRDDSAKNMMRLSFISVLPEIMKKYSKISTILKENALEYSQSLAEQAALAAHPANDAQLDIDPALAAVAIPDRESLPTVTLDGVALVSGANGLHAVPPLQPFASGPGTGSPTIPTIQISLDATPSNSQMESIPADPVPNATTIATPAASVSEAPLAAVANGTITTTTVSDDPFNPTPAELPSAVITWKAHPIDLQEIFTKFHRGKYYTPGDLLDDMLKIEENAKMVGNVDEICKIGDMVVQLKMWIGDFEPRWAPEFERLKVRMMEKKETRRKERERVKAAAAGGSLSAGSTAIVGESPTEQNAVGVSSGPAADNLTNGADASTSVESDHAMAVEAQSGAKRPREDDEEGGIAKKAREDEMDLDTASQSLALDTLPQPSTDPTSAASMTDSVIAPPAYPPLTIPPTLSTLAAELRHKTGDLNIDQLEQIRAGCFDLLWRKRGEWDRTQVVGEAREWVAGFLEEVKEEGESD